MWQGIIMEPSFSDLERSFPEVRKGGFVTHRYNDMWPVAHENVFEVGIRRITSAVESFLLIVCPYGSDQLEVIVAKDTNGWQLSAYFK
jgi:hypothetical protein